MELFLKYFIIFIIYSILGWILEILEIFIFEKKLFNRGFLIGPYCPIYGVGGILLVLLLNKYSNEPLTLFVLAVFICAILEYFTSWILEKIFKLRWWDYSHKKYNVNGRINLETMVYFGIGGTLIVCLINPFLLNLLDKITYNSLVVICAILAGIFLIDAIVSIHLIINFKKITKKINKDSTEDIKKYIKHHINNDKSLYNRLINSFPGLQKGIDKKDKQKRKTSFKK